MDSETLTLQLLNDRTTPKIRTHKPLWVKISIVSHNTSLLLTYQKTLSKPFRYLMLVFYITSSS